MPQIMSRHKRILEYLTSRIEPVALNGNSLNDQIVTTPEPCPTFERLKEIVFGPRTLEWRQEIEDTLAVCLATILSTGLRGAQLGIRVIGPPGSVKSTIAESLSVCREMVYPVSKFTGMVSGLDKVKKTEQLASLVNGKTMIIKDADSLMQTGNLAEIESELRDSLGDAVIRYNYRTGKRGEIYTLYTVIIFGTQGLKNMDNPMLGPRFLDVRIHEKGSDTSSIVDRCIDSQFETLTSQLSVGESNTLIPVQKDMLLKMAPYVYGFLVSKKKFIDSGIRINPLTPLQKQRIKAMAELVSYIRARINKDKEGFVQNDEREIGSRVSEQLTRLLVVLAIVNSDEGASEVTVSGKEFRIAARVVRDTLEGHRFNIAKFLVQNKFTSQEISGEVNLSNGHCHRILMEMLYQEIIVREQVSLGNGQGGFRAYYSLSEEVEEIFRVANVLEKGKQNAY